MLRYGVRMRRSKDASCESSRTGDSSNGTGSAPNQPDTGPHYQFDITPGYNIVEMDTKERTVAANSAINRNQTVNSLREISDAKLKDGDITALLTDNDWKGMTWTLA